MSSRLDPHHGDPDRDPGTMPARRPTAPPMRHATRQLGFSLLAVAAPAAGLLAVALFGPLDVLRLAALSALVALGAGLPLVALWQRASLVDRLAERVDADARSSVRVREPVARIAEGLATLGRRLEAHEAAGDPARRDDPTTGLPNRQTAMGRARDEISRARRTGQPFAVALIALDIGPAVEDVRLEGQQTRALRLLAEFLMQGLRAYDVVARWDRELFVAMLPEAEIEHAVAAVERIRDMAGSGWSIRGGEPLPAIHGGVAVLQPDDATLTEIVARAERALDRARQGIGAAVQATPGPRTQPVRLAPV